VFKHRLVRDLAWVISSPPLVSGNINNTHWWSSSDCTSEYQDCLPALIVLDKNPEPLITNINNIKAKGLGHRFEALVAYWIKLSPNFDLLDNNIQIIVEGKTFGEIDFIIQDIRSKKIIHLEVAVKFYLGSPPYHNAFYWYGTNTKDQLGKKIKHLKEKQTQLATIHKSFLKNRGFEINEKHCLLKGRLFYPLAIDKAPNGVNSDHLRARWIQHKAKPNNALYYPLDKPNWLATLYHDDIHDDLLEPNPKASEWPKCYSQIKKKKSGEYQEISRVFSLPEDFTFPEKVKN